MTKFQQLVLRWILGDLFIQGYDHHVKLAKVYKLIRQVWEEEFTEDNGVTTDAMLREAFEASQATGHEFPVDINAVRELKSKI